MARAPEFKGNGYVQQRKWKKTRTLYRQVLVLSEVREQGADSEAPLIYIRRLGARRQIVDDRATRASLRRTMAISYAYKHRLPTSSAYFSFAYSPE